MSRDYARLLFELTRESNDPRARNMGLWTRGVSDALNWAYEEAINNGREGAHSALSEVDKFMAQAALGAALGMSGRVEEALPLLQSFHDTLSERGFLVALVTLDLFLGPTLVVSGDMGRGVRVALQCRERNVKWGSSIGVAFANLVLGEIYTQIACGEEKPPLAVMRHNFWFLLRTLPRATKLARKYLEPALIYFRRIDAPSSIARTLYDLALIDLKQRRKEVAREKLAEALGLAKSVEADARADKVEAALLAI